MNEPEPDQSFPPESGVLPPPPSILQASDRISWNSRFYYEQDGEDIVEVGSSGWALTKSKDSQPYIRQMPLTKRMPVDIGHVEDPRLIIIDNTTKWRGMLQPSDEDREVLADSFVIVMIGEERVAELGPKQEQHFWVTSDIAARMTLMPSRSGVRVKMSTFAR